MRISDWSSDVCSSDLTAFQDSTPMVLFVGQIARAMTEREAFQEMDFRRFFDQASKWAAQIDDAARIPELVSHAFHTATAGRPGPVVQSGRASGWERGGLYG